MPNELLLNGVIELAQQAGEMIRREFYRPEGPRGYGGKAPIDIEIEELLRRELLLLTPTWSILGEELPFLRGSDPDYCWVLDPQDGTSAFLRGFRGSSVSIGLLRNHEPVLGVVYAPLYPNDRGDLLAGAEGVGLFRNCRPITRPCPTSPLSPSDIVAVGQDADRRIETNICTLAPARYLALPSVAYRLALAAVGEVRVGLSLAPLRTLDVAASHALLKLSGRDLRKLEESSGTELDYQNETAFHGAIGGDTAATSALTPWPWDKMFGAREPSRLCEPSGKRRVGIASALSRAQGCLLGQFVGSLLPSLELTNTEVYSILSSQPGAGSEMALALARQLLKDEEFHAKHVKGAYRLWLKSRPTEVDDSIKNALEHTPDQVSQSCGSLTRCTPLGIAFSAEQLTDIAPEECRITHLHPTCLECCRLFTQTISRAMEGWNEKDAVQQALRDSSDEIQDLLNQAISKPPTNTEHDLSGVKVAFHNAFHHLAQGTPLSQALVATLEIGGDTNSNSSVCGALLGAYQGYDAIPKQWRLSVLTCRPHPGNEQVYKPRPTQYWSVDTLILAERLLEIR